MEVSELSPPQRLAVESLVHGKDVLVCLPTGSGKSMIFQILPSVCCYLSSKGVSGFPSDPIVVVASPLLALMRNQVAAMKRKQQSAALVEENPACDQQIRDGLVTFIYGSPEVLVGNPAWRDLWKTSQYQKRVIAFAVDEVHTAVHWYVVTR